MPGALGPDASSRIDSSSSASVCGPSEPQILDRVVSVSWTRRKSRKDWRRTVSVTHEPPPSDKHQSSVSWFHMVAGRRSKTYLAMALRAEFAALFQVSCPRCLPHT